MCNNRGSEHKKLFLTRAAASAVKHPFVHAQTFYVLFFCCVKNKYYRMSSSSRAGSRSSISHHTSLLQVETEDVKTRGRDFSREELGDLPNDKKYRLVIKGSPTAIQKHSFLKCFMMKEVIVPPSVTVLKESCFELCTALETVVLPSRLIYTIPEL